MDKIREQFVQALRAATTSEALEKVRVDFLSRKGLIMTLSKNVDFGAMSAEMKREFGQKLNELKEVGA